MEKLVFNNLFNGGKMEEKQIRHYYLVGLENYLEFQNHNPLQRLRQFLKNMEFLMQNINQTKYKVDHFLFL